MLKTAFILLVSFSLPAQAQEICQSAADVLCSPEANPYLGKAKAAADEFYEILDGSMADPRMVEYLQKTDNPQAKSCADVRLSQVDQLNCKVELNRTIEPKLYSRERTQKGKELFQQAKALLHNVLDQRQLQLNQKGRREADPTIQKMKQRLDEIDVDLKANPQRLLGYIAALPGIPRLNQSNDALVHPKNNIIVEGMITLVDHNPKGLLFVLLHELGHAIGLSRFRANDHYDGHPFQNQLKCLKRGDSVEAKPSDSACFAQKSKDYANTYELRMFERPLKEMALMTRLNPDIAVAIPPIGVTCQMGQLGEAWSDWLAVEGLVINAGGEGDKLKDSLFAAAAQLCPQFPVVEKPHDSHPAMKDRLNAILSVHPAVKAAIGCPAAELKNSEDQARESKVYCGADLD